jgi:hypothetical protein
MLLLLVDEGEIVPDDRYKRLHLSRIRPEKGINPDPAPCYHLVVLGAGTSGLVSTGAAA